MAIIKTIKPERPPGESMDGVRRNFRGHFIKKAIPVSVRREIARRYGCSPGQAINAQCAYCGSTGQISWIQQPTDRSEGWVYFAGLEMDHIVPEITGGKNVADNINLACRPCNRNKGQKTISHWLGVV